jgi:copper homeostasis protein CutC
VELEITKLRKLIGAGKEASISKVLTQGQSGPNIRKGNRQIRQFFKHANSKIQTFLAK